MPKTGSMNLCDRVRDRAKKREHIGGLTTLNLPEGVELYKPEKGRVEFDILPYKVSVDTHPEVKAGVLWYERMYLAHRKVGPEERPWLICPRTIGKKCPICEEYYKLSRDPDADEDVVAGLKAKERELFNVVLKDGKGVVQVLDISVWNFGMKLEEEVREGDEANATFPELKGGKTLKVRWENETIGSGKPFPVASRIDFEDRDEDYDTDALESVVDLDKAMIILSYEEIEAIFHGADDKPVKAKEDDSDSGDDDKPKRSLRRVTKSEEDDRGEEEPEPEEEKERIEKAGLKGKSKKEGSEAEPEDCTACEGTGKTSKGKTCPICGGTGKDDDGKSGKAKDPEEPEEGEAGAGERPAKRQLRRIAR